MLKKGLVTRLADKISDILTTTPSIYDPENIPDDTNAKLTDNTENDVDQNIISNDEEAILSKFRKQNIDLLCDVDVKYAGKKASRKKLKDSESEVEDSDNKESNDGFITEKTNIDNENQETDTEMEEGSEEDESVDESRDEDEENWQTEYEEDMNPDDLEDTNEDFTSLKKDNLDQQTKGLHVKNQLAMWENLLEIRIQLQKCLLGANKMPSPELYKEMKKNSNSELNNKIAETKQSVSNLLDKFLLLENLLLKRHPETKNLKNNQNIEDNDDNDDEEIPSDTDDEKMNKSDEDIEEEEYEQPQQMKRRKLEDYENELNSNFTMYRNYRNSVIQKWSDKTRIGTKTNNQESVLDQINYILNDKERLIKRTHLRRSEYNIIGDDLEKCKTKNDYNDEIFDDDDFYHQLLRDLIEVKSADLTDPIQLGRQWIQLQNIRSKMKRNIDTRATKGRKIRFVVHNKLVNFMAPIDQNLWTDDAKTELYNSLFGKNQY